MYNFAFGSPRRNASSAMASMLNTLFNVGFKKKTTETTGAELSAASTARVEQEKADRAATGKRIAEKQKEAMQSSGTVDGMIKKANKEKSRNPEAVRKAKYREKIKKKKAKRDKSAVDSEKAETVAAAVDFEKETHVSIEATSIEAKGTDIVNKSGEKKAHGDLAKETSAFIQAKGEDIVNQSEETPRRRQARPSR